VGFRNGVIEELGVVASFGVTILIAGVRRGRGVVARLVPAVAPAACLFTQASQPD
jgi:hypothetical protein